MRDVAEPLEVDLPLGRLAEHALGDRRRERRPVPQHLLAQLAADALQVQVRDALMVLLEEGDRVTAGVGVVAGVQAEHDRRIGVREQALHLPVVLHVRIGVRVEHHLQPVARRPLLGTIRGIDQPGPRRVVQFLGTFPLTGVQIRVHIVDEDDEARPELLERPGHVIDVAEYQVGRFLVLQVTHDEAAAELQGALRKLLLQHVGVGRQVADRPQLRPFIAGRGRLIQVPLPGGLLRIRRKPDTPRIRPRPYGNRHMRRL